MPFRFWKKHTEDGCECPDPTPIEIPLKQRPLTLQERLFQIAQAPDLRAALMKREADTFEDAEDFGDEEPLGDDFPGTPYEMREMAEDRDVPVQTRMDEIKGGAVENVPEDRLRKAQDRLRAPKKEKAPPATPEPPKGEGGAK